MKKALRNGKGIIFIGVIFLLTAFSVSAQIAINGSDETYRKQEAYKDLLQTKTFTFAAFGYAAVPFRSTQSLVYLLKEKDAEKLLREIVKSANPEGQVYALIGLQVIKSKHFEAEFEYFKQKIAENEVTNISSEDGGCDPTRITLKIEEVVKKIESKEYAKIFAEKYISR
jgi:hypothetical protein